MTNEIYIPKELAGVLKSLSPVERRHIVQAIDALEEHVLENSRVISTAGPAKGELREARAGDLRLLFRYTPEDHAIILTDVCSHLSETTLAHAIA